MSTQQDIYAAGSENRPPMLNKENYVPWSPRLLRYAKSRPIGKLIHNSIINGPYVRRMISEPSDPNRENSNGNGNLIAARAEGNATGHNADLDEIEEVNAKCILMANLQQAMTSGTQTDKAPIYDSEGSAEKTALGYQNAFYLKQAQQKQQSLYDGKVLFEKHDPPVVHDSEETL
nr:ribonuclease H-like domain-containing protein [Tanacetum cinerariifolium]